MVVLEAAAISAAAYGAYRGGEEATKKAKQKMREINLERRHKTEYSAKSKERKERLAAITAKHSGSAAASSSSTTADAENRTNEERLAALKANHSASSGAGSHRGSSKTRGLSSMKSSVLSRLGKKNGK
mmetsp:Transcript_29599/g.55002  ORF Transcript_29599/g.55002 Transcript_29599/m.55002 type:complete len:129 (-) Transcript_29599:520-906(-)